MNAEWPKPIQLHLNDKTKSKRQKWTWNKRNLSRSDDIKEVMDEIRDYWPLTERQIYYRLISSKKVHGDHWLWKGSLIDIYAALIRILKWMRIDDHIPMKAITDEHRIVTTKLGFSNAGDFIDYRLGNLGRGYSRCNAQKQDRYIEVWVEKAALLHIVEPIADLFCRRVVVCKGYLSITFQAAFYERAMEAVGLGQTPTVLYFGDWDPSGVNMIYSAMQTLTDDLGLCGVEFHRCGINPEHLNMIDASPVPLKMTDTRTKDFIQQHGTTAYELDAFHPEQLQKIVRASIMDYTDMQSYGENAHQGQLDKEKIDMWSDEVSAYGEEVASQLGL
jgi:hypothetical protein